MLRVRTVRERFDGCDEGPTLSDCVLRGLLGQVPLLFRCRVTVLISRPLKSRTGGRGCGTWREIAFLVGGPVTLQFANERISLLFGDLVVGRSLLDVPFALRGVRHVLRVPEC